MKKTLKILFFVIFAIFFVCTDSFSFSLDDVLKNVSKESIDEKLNGVKKLQDTFSSIDRASEPITPVDSYEIGRTVSASILKQYPLYDGKKATAYLNKICKAIALNSDTPAIYKDYCVGILDTDEINALSTCGGHIFISTGLLQCCTSEDAVASVIAHEMAHIQLEHAVSAIKTSRTTTAINKTASTAQELSALSGESRQIFTDLTSSSLAVLDVLVEKGYPKEQEYKADELAVKLMVQTGYDPNAMVDMLQVLDQMHANESSDEKGWKKTHPKPADRIKRVKAAITKSKYTGTADSARDARFKKNIGETLR